MFFQGRLATAHLLRVDSLVHAERASSHSRLHEGIDEALEVQTYQQPDEMEVPVR